MPALDLSIAQSSDDAVEATAGTVVINGTTVGNDLDAITEFVGLRYTGGPPQGATITGAYLTVRISANGSDEPDVTIYGEDADAGLTFTTAANNISSRARTASATWSQTDLGVSAPQDQNSTDITTPIQAVVNRAGYSGTIVLIIQGSANAARDLDFRLFNHADGAAGAPRLHIDYTTGGASSLGGARYYRAQL
jgi:hypothetical protein